MARRINYKAVRKFWPFMGEKTVLCSENAKKGWYNTNWLIQPVNCTHSGHQGDGRHKWQLEIYVYTVQDCLWAPCTE